jgi:DNA (cytosine-5)-methyltransferase 1
MLLLASASYTPSGAAVGKQVLLCCCGRSDVSSDTICYGTHASWWELDALRKARGLSYPLGRLDAGDPAGGTVCTLTSVEICAGAGGQALGLEQAGFAHAAVVEIDADACETLRLNRGSDWKIVEGDVHCLDSREFRGVDLVAAGVPCPPFSIAGKQLGSDDDRDLFPQALRLVEDIAPRAVLLENVRGLAARRFNSYRATVVRVLNELGYMTWWDLIHASEHGIPQLRPRFVLVAVRAPWASCFRWPARSRDVPPTVGEALHDLMGAAGWPGVELWRQQAQGIAPTIVGGSKKHGGPDLGPTRARAAWKMLGVNGLGIATEAPGPEVPPGQLPKLTLRMVARLQGFPDDWQFAGRKTSVYRQVGNAFPPPIARVLGAAIMDALNLVTPAGGYADLAHHASFIPS